MFLPKQVSQNFLFYKYFFFCWRLSTKDEIYFLNLCLPSLVCIYSSEEQERVKHKDVKVGSTHIDSMFPCIVESAFIKTLTDTLQTEGAAAAVPPVCVSPSIRPCLSVCLTVHCVTALLMATAEPATF